MPLKRCKDCGGDVSPRARSCRRCGAIRQLTPTELLASAFACLLAIPLLGVLLVIVAMIVASVFGW
jgi:hypothetical protein